MLIFKNQHLFGLLQIVYIILSSLLQFTIEKIQYMFHFPGSDDPKAKRRAIKGVGPWKGTQEEQSLCATKAGK